MLQGRLFSYPDTHRHRLGANYDLIHINCPYRAKIANTQRDGPMRVDKNGGNTPNYEPNSLGPNKANFFSFNQEARYEPYRVTGLVARHKPNHPNCDFAQPGALYRKVMCDVGKQNTIVNIVGSMKGVPRDILERAVKNFLKSDPEYGDGIAKSLGFPSIKSRL